MSQIWCCVQDFVSLHGENQCDQEITEKRETVWHINMEQRNSDRTKIYVWRKEHNRTSENKIYVSKPPFSIKPLLLK